MENEGTFCLSYEIKFHREFILNSNVFCKKINNLCKYLF